MCGAAGPKGLLTSQTDVASRPCYIQTCEVIDRRLSKTAKDSTSSVFTAHLVESNRFFVICLYM